MHGQKKTHEKTLKITHQENENFNNEIPLNIDWKGKFKRLYQVLAKMWINKKVYPDVRNVKFYNHFEKQLDSF